MADIDEQDGWEVKTIVWSVVALSVSAAVYGVTWVAVHIAEMLR